MQPLLAIARILAEQELHVQQIKYWQGIKRRKLLPICFPLELPDRRARPEPAELFGKNKTAQLQGH